MFFGSSEFFHKVFTIIKFMCNFAIIRFAVIRLLSGISKMWCPFVSHMNWELVIHLGSLCTTGSFKLVIPINDSIIDK